MLLKPEIFSPKMKTPLRAGLCVEFERKNNDLNDINEIKEIKESLLNILKIFHLFNLFRLFPYGLCRRDCKSSLSQREDLGGNVSMGVVSHLLFVAFWVVSSGLQVLPFAKGGFRRECECECECHTFFCSHRDTKKGVSCLYRTATTAYPCLLPHLGGSAGAGRIRLTPGDKSREIFLSLQKK